MDNAHTTTRRSFLKAMPGAAAAVALPTAALATTTAADEPADLLALARRFGEDAKRIDPTLIGSCVGFDELEHGPIETRVNGVFLSRGAARPVAASETQGAAPSIGLTLAAEHAEKVAEAMAHPDIHGDWSVSIKSGKPDQIIAFRNDIAAMSSVRRAIEAHRHAWQAFEDSVPFGDDLDPRYSKAGKRRSQRPGRLEERTFVALLNLPVDGAAASAKANYLLKCVTRDRMSLEYRFIVPLLRSMAGVL